MEPKVSVFHYSSICPYPEPDHSSLRPSFFFKSRCSIIYGSASLPQVSPPEFCMHSFFSPHSATFPAISQSLLRLPWWEVQNMKLTMQFSLLYVTFWRLGPNILLSTLIWNTLIPCSSRDLRDQISHVCKTTSKLILHCILIFVCINRKREGKRFWNIWWQAFLQFHLLLVSSWMQLFLISAVVPCVLTLLYYRVICSLCLYPDFVLHCGGVTWTYVVF